MRKIYIACSLTHVPRDQFDGYVNFIHTLATNLNEFNVKYALVNSDPQLVNIPVKDKAKYCYQWDRNMVEEADLIIAECSYPSIGLGIELQIAEFKSIPSILIFKNDLENKAAPVSYRNPDMHSHNLQIGEGYISLMALGLPNIVKVIKYQGFEDLFQNIYEEINKIFQN